MLSSLKRGATVAAVVALATLALAAADAFAVPVTEITSPANGASVTGFFESDSFAVEGSSSLAEPLQIRCYFGSGEQDFDTLAEHVEPAAGGKFAVPAPFLRMFPGPCQLRAVPAAVMPSMPIGSAQAYEGPVVAPSYAFPFLQLSPTTYAAAASTLQRSFGFTSASAFGLTSVVLSLGEDLDVFFGDSALRAEDGAKNRAGLVVDGQDAYGPQAAEELKLGTPPNLTLHEEYEPARHELTLREEDPIVRCSPGGYPPSATNCTSFVATGVTLTREWHTSQEETVATMSDSFRSTDGARHTLDIRYWSELGTVGGGGAFRFPGEGALAPVAVGEQRTAPAGAGTIFYEWKAGTSEAGDGTHPFGAIVYDGTLGGPILVAGKELFPTEPSTLLELPYQRAVAPGSPTTIRMGFVQGMSIPEIAPKAEALADALLPSISISSPASGSSVAASSVAVGGLASDTAGPVSVSVDGQLAAVGAGGAWSATVPLSPGSNTITATATDEAGLSRSASVVVHDTAGGGPAPARLASVARSGSLKLGRERVFLTLSCSAAGRGPCQVQLALTTVEHLRSGKVTALTAARKRSKTVTIGSLKATLATGTKRRFAIPLNRTGHRLLHHFHKLPFKLTARRLGTGAAKPPVLFTLAATLKLVHRR